jgi:hypothetical protein
MRPEVKMRSNQLREIDIRQLEHLRGSFRDCRHRMSGTAHHGLGGLIPDIERFFETRYWPSIARVGIETGKLLSVGECLAKNLKVCGLGSGATSPISWYGYLGGLDKDKEIEPEWRTRFWADCTGLGSILARYPSLIEQACSSWEASYYSRREKLGYQIHGFEIMPALFGFAQRLGPELGVTVAEGGLFPNAGWMLPIAWAKENALAFLRQNDPSLENLSLSDFDADYEFSRHHRFALIENLPWTASLLTDWMAGQLARCPSNSYPNSEQEGGKVAGADGEKHPEPKRKPGRPKNPVNEGIRALAKAAPDKLNFEIAKQWNEKHPDKPVTAKKVKSARRSLRGKKGRKQK